MQRDYFLMWEYVKLYPQIYGSAIKQQQYDIFLHTLKNLYVLLNNTKIVLENLITMLSKLQHLLDEGKLDHVKYITLWHRIQI